MLRLCYHAPDIELFLNDNELAPRGEIHPQTKLIEHDGFIDGVLYERSSLQESQDSSEIQTFSTFCMRTGSISYLCRQSCHK
jgi:hypothetical protein